MAEGKDSEPKSGKVAVVGKSIFTDLGKTLPPQTRIEDIAKIGVNTGDQTLTHVNLENDRAKRSTKKP